MIYKAKSEEAVDGGMGRTHRLESTFPRLAEHLGYVPKEDILYAVKAIVVAQRENGRRDDRKYSRMKYLLSSWGIEKFRTVVEQYYGKKFDPCIDLPEWEFKSYLGIGMARADWPYVKICSLIIVYSGIFMEMVDNGRIKGTMKKTLWEIIEKYSLNVRITPNQNIVLCDIRQAWKRPITTALAQGGLLQPRYVDPLNVTAMACPALPLCPLVIAEAERGIPDILKRVRAVFEKLWLGGTPNQTSLVRIIKDKVKIQDLEKVLEPLFYHWKSKQISKELFGDFTYRMGNKKLLELVDRWEGIPSSPSRCNLKLFADKKTYETIDGLAKLQEKSAHELTMEIISNYVASHQNENIE
ncbi:hypothetical protein BUALT_Bualt02G0183300 [Buddleja alternifolia]|uniref:Uncharacterized protein n=1 Tax=Buddleja alternifolia TaxID=168488 RepID=A0AAV6Y2G4_9LAMI|nr:hypothetical protein BUALT_Bualt02G0183300 [Buddleja alternifolia]